jgi:hypothetical protein
MLRSFLVAQAVNDHKKGESRGRDPFLVFLLRGCRASTTPAIRLPAVGYWKVSGTGKVADPGEKTAAAAYGKGVRDPPVITYIWSFWTVRYPRPGQPLAQFASRGNVQRPSALLHAEPLPHSTSSCAASPAVAACRESHRCHLVATLRAEEEPSCRCRRLPQPGAPLRVARAASRRHRPSTAPRAALPLFCRRIVPLSLPAASPPCCGVGRS